MDARKPGPTCSSESPTAGKTTFVSSKKLQSEFKRESRSSVEARPGFQRFSASNSKAINLLPSKMMASGIRFSLTYSDKMNTLRPEFFSRSLNHKTTES